MALLRESGLGQPDEVRLPYPRQPAPVARSIAWKPTSDAYYLLAARLRQSGYEHELYITQRALLQMLDHSSGSEREVEGVLWGRLFVSPDSGFSYVLIAETSPGIDGAAARVSGREGPLRRAGWYSSRDSVGAQLEGDDVAIHLERCTGGWEPAIVMSRGGAAPDGAVFLVSPLSRRSYRAPFRELLEPQVIRENAPKRSCIPWLGYVTDEPVVALPSRERGLARSRESADLGGRPIVSLIAEGVASDVRSVTEAIARAARRSTTLFRRATPPAPENAWLPEPERAMAPQELAEPEAEAHSRSAEAESVLQPPESAAGLLTPPEPLPVAEEPPVPLPPRRATPLPPASSRPSSPARTPPRIRQPMEQRDRLPAVALVAGAIAALVGALTLGVVAISRVLPSHNVSAGAVAPVVPDERAIAGARARAATEGTDSLAAALLWYDEIAADHRAGRLSCAPVLQAVERVMLRRDSLARVVAALADSTAARTSRELIERAGRIEQSVAASECGDAIARSAPND